MHEQEGRNISSISVLKKLKKFWTWGWVNTSLGEEKIHSCYSSTWQPLDPLLSGWGAGIEKARNNEIIMQTTQGHQCCWISWPVQRRKRSTRLGNTPTTRLPQKIRQERRRKNGPRGSEAMGSTREHWLPWRNSASDWRHWWECWRLPVCRWDSTSLESVCGKPSYWSRTHFKKSPTLRTLNYYLQ